MRRRRRLLLCGLLLVVALAVPANASADVQPKVVGGSNASISQYPWQVAVLRSGQIYCGGALITTRIVLTAGHCVSGQSASSFTVVLGRTTLSNTSEGTSIPVQALAAQSNYRLIGGVPRYDVGYLLLASASSQPRIQIAGGTEGGLWSPGVVETITGWGCPVPPGGVFGCGGPLGPEPSDTLQAAQVPIVDDNTCGLDYPGLFDKTTMVCAGYQAGGVDSCNGDSGGPLQAPLGGGAYREVGITSWGVSCGQANAPGVYTRVADPGIRPLVGADVCNLETANGLAHEQVIAGAIASEEPCIPGLPTTRSASPTAKKTHKKCKRIHNKRKRRRCLKKHKRKK
jgi:trypsin